MERFYPIAVLPLSDEDGGGYLGFAPDLPGCMSHGDTPEEAFANAQQASQEWIEESKAQNRTIPEPGSAVARARAERDTLLAKIRDQGAAIDRLQTDISKIETDFSQIQDIIKERLSADPRPWGPFIPEQVLSNGCSSDEIVR